MTQDAVRGVGGYQLGAERFVVRVAQVGLACVGVPRGSAVGGAMPGSVLRWPVMGEASRDLREYYEEEARLGRRSPPTGRRVAFRDDFVGRLEREGRRSVLDLGAGPASDGPGFVDRGLRYVGLDLARRNAGLAAERGFTVVPGSMAAPPFRSSSFDAGWSMSALMHVPEAEVARTLEQMVEPLRAGSPLAVGLWGGARRDEIETTSLPGRRRLFSVRPFERNRDLLSGCGVIEWSELWDNGPDSWQYHVFVVRTPLRD